MRKLLATIFLFFSITSTTFAVTTTFFPDPNPETTSTDGRAEQGGGAGLSWTAITVGSGSGADSSTASQVSPYLFGEAAANTWSTMRRTFFLFDTSAIGAGATVSSSTFSFNATAKVDNATLNQSIAIVGASTTLNTSIAIADYALTASATQRYSPDVDLGLISTTGYSHFLLNSDGLNNVSLTSITKIGVRFHSEVNRVEPTWVASNSNVTIDHAETAGTATDPKLVVTYTAAAAASSPSIESDFWPWEE